MFALYRTGHFGHRLKPMLSLWNKLARAHGFIRGIYFLATLNNFYDENAKALLSAVPQVRASFHFLPTLRRSPLLKKQGPGSALAASTEDVKSAMVTQYWGVATGFDTRVRKPTPPKGIIRISSEELYTSLHQSFQAMDVRRWRHVCTNYIFVNAWNEWNEQAVLEPDDVNGCGHLRAIQTALARLPTHRVVQQSLVSMVLGYS